LLYLVAAAIPVAIWAFLLTARGGFWRVSRNLPPRAEARWEDRKIAVVIPARDEEAVIGETVRSLLTQNWTPPLHVFVVDDNSNDRTAEAAHRAAEALERSFQLTVLSGKPLAPGWTGKLWALSQGVEKALNTRPDFLLFTDADIQHDPDNLRSLVSIAEGNGYDLASFMVKLSCGTFAEKALIPAFVFFFFQLYPPVWIRSQAQRTAGAAGGCVLIRPAALLSIGGLAAIRSAVIDDCALARAVKRKGGQVWLGLTPTTHSTRIYSSFGEVGAMIARTAFNQLHHSSLLLVGTLFGLFFTYLLPVILLFSGHLTLVLLGSAAYSLMTIAYWPMVRFYGLPGYWAAALPLAAVFYMGATVASAIRYWKGVGGSWKGRAQDLAR
jgi:hopene-associated glycosyltransferase HpnB